MISISYKDGRPIFEQVKDSLRNLIITGALKEGDRMPSVRELASGLAINPNTIQRAYRELETEGYICSLPGKGSFVSDRADADVKRRAELMESFRAAARELRLTGARQGELETLIREVYEND